jgi:hypothetical protein
VARSFSLRRASPLSLGASYGTLSFGRLQRFCIRKLGVHRVAPNCGVPGLKDFAKN